MQKITITYIDSRFDDSEFSDGDKADLIMAMIEGNVLDLRDEFVSGLTVEVAGN